MIRKLRACRALPPRKALGACSTMRTVAPARRAAIAAHSAAQPPPTTRTSDICPVSLMNLPRSAIRLRLRGDLYHAPVFQSFAASQDLFDGSSKWEMMDSKTPLADVMDWRIEPVDPSLEPPLRARIDGKAKPPGALGRLEDLAVQLGSIWHPEPPRTENATVFVFAGDHGITAEGVSPYPSSVTAAMVATYLAGRAGVNALARASDVEVRGIDAGVDADLPHHPGLIDAKIRRGTRNAAVEAALTSREVNDCLERGAAIVETA